MKSNPELPFFLEIDGGESDARVVINGDLHILPTRAGNMVSAIAGDTMEVAGSNS